MNLNIIYTMSKGNTTVIVTVVGILVVIAGLLSLSYFNNGTPSTLRDTSELPCLLPNIDLAMHIHLKLHIIVDDKEEIIPANIGLTDNCHKPLHTHETDNELHVESQTIRDYTLGEFMSVWGKSIERDGYSVAMTIDDNPSAELGAHIFRDKEKIVLDYKKTVETKTE